MSSPIIVGGFPCTQTDCDKVYNRAPDLARHLKFGHGPRDRYGCSLCPRTFNDPVAANSHRIAHDRGVEQFWEKVKRDPETGCWNWQGTKDYNGYGRARWLGKMVKAYRLSYWINVGPFPDELTMDHLCRNRHCVNPAHLEPVTHQENMRRALSSRVVRQCTDCEFSTPNLPALLNHIRWKHRPKVTSDAGRADA